MPLLVSTGLGLLVREFTKRVNPARNQAAPALTRGLYTVSKRNVARRRRLYQSDPFSSDELKQRLGGCCVRRYCSSVSSNETSSGERSNILKVNVLQLKCIANRMYCAPNVVTSRLSNENWVPVYRFKKIPLYSGVSRAKFIQTMFSVILVPYQSYEYFTEAITLNFYLGSLAFAAVAPLVLIGFTRFFNRIIGVVAFDEEQKLVRFGYLGFWGGRKNLIVSLDEVMPLTDLYDVDTVKAIIRLDLVQKGYLLLSLRDCEIVNEELATEIFGNLKYFKKFE